MLIFAKAMNGKIIRVKIAAHSTVIELKDALKRENPQHIQSASFRLISRARVLSEKKTLYELGISNQQMLTLVEVEKVCISDPNSPVNEPEPEPKPKAAHSSDAKISAPIPFAAQPPKPDQPAKRPTPISAIPRISPSDSFHKVVRTASAVLPSEEEKSPSSMAICPQGARPGGGNPLIARPLTNTSPAAAAAIPTKKVSPSAWGGADSFHKVVRTASKILPTGSEEGESPKEGSFRASPKGNDSPFGNGIARTRSGPKDEPIREEEIWSGEEDEARRSKPNGEKASVSTESERGEEDVFQTAMLALSEVVAVMEGVKGSVEAAAKKLERLEGSVAQLNGLSQRVAAAESRAGPGGAAGSKEELLGSLAQRLAKVERALQ